MPDLWMDIDTGLAEVPVNILPLIDDGDFKTRETGVAYDAAGMDLVWNFTTTGGAFTQTAVTPTSGGDYDWAHQGDGMYTIEIPAFGGASINNDTEGFGWFTGIATGVLPWRGPVIGFRAALINNSLVDGINIAVNVADMEEDVLGAIGRAPWLDSSSPNILTVDLVDGSSNTLTLNVGAGDYANDFFNGMIAIHIDSGGVKQGVRIVTDYVASTQIVTIAGTWPVTPVVGDGVAFFPFFPLSYLADIDGIMSTLGTPAGASVSADIADVEGKVDDLESRLGTPSNLGSGATIAANLADIEGQTDDIGSAGAGLTNIPWNAAWDAEVQSEVVDALTVDTYAEVSGVPAATSSLKDKINWLFALARNKINQTSSTQTLRNDADSGNIATASVSDDGTTATRAEWS